MWEEQLHQAVDLIKKKQYTEAVTIIRQVLRQDPDNTSALWLMANAIHDPKQQEKILKRLLSINPNHKNAKKLLATIRKTPKSKPKQEKDYDWSKMSAKAKDEKELETSNGSNLIAFAAVLIAIVAIVIFAVVAYVRYAPILNQTPIERELSQLARNYLKDLLLAQRADANDRLCVDERLTALQVADISVEAGGTRRSLRINASDIRVTEIEQTNNSARGLLVGNMVLHIQDGDETRTQTIPIADLLRENIDVIGGIRSTRWRFVYELDEWRICP